MLTRHYFLMNEEPLLGGGSGGAGAGANSGGGQGAGDLGDNSGQGDGGSPGDFQFPANNFPEGVEQDIAEDPSLKVFIKDEQLNMANLMKSYVHSQRLIGKDKIIIPDKHATEQDWNNFYDKIGRPAAEGYELQAEGDNEDFVKGFKEKAHAAGLVNKQAQELYDYFKEQAVAANSGMVEQQQEAYQEELNGLKKEWGEGFDRELKAANSALEEFASKEEIEALKEAGVASNITLVKIFNKIANGLKEDNFKEEAHGDFGITPEAAQQRINTILGDKNHAYNDKSHPNHANAISEVQKLFQKVYPVNK